MASTAGAAPSTGLDALQTRATGHLYAFLGRVELWLEKERAQMPLWLPVLLGVGIAAWFAFPLKSMWLAVILIGGALAVAGLALGLKRRSGVALCMGGLALAAGCALIWVRAEQVAGPVLAKPQVVMLSGTIARADRLLARDLWRLTIRPDAALHLPKTVRVSVALDDLDHAPAAGARITVRARLVPPPEPAIPGSYNFQRTAWFQGLGGVGTALDPPESVSAKQSPGLRARLSAHIETRLTGDEAGIAAALATGEQGLISLDGQEAMRTSGLAHLLSVSGLHISAVVAAVFLMVRLVLALSPWVALRWPVPLIAAGAAALAAIGYTLLTGAEVPTVRSCIAAIFVLIGMALGREALTLRLVATGALIVLLLWPEALIGPSFQLSFAAITAIVALHDAPRVQRWFAIREEGRFRRLMRAFAALLLTGIVVEIALMPVALFHFHKAGVYGALANLVAIPLTTFVIMPAEALALLFDLAGLGAPFWWITGQAIAALLWLAHRVAETPGASALLPSLPGYAYALITGGGLWVMLWRSRARFWGLVPLGVGLVWALVLPPPDLLVTGDGRHMAVRDDRGQWTILRPRSGDYIRQTLAERAAYAGDLADMDTASKAQCSLDACVLHLHRAGRRWTILAIRSRHRILWAEIVAACKNADIIVSERLLPRACTPRWLRMDPAFLRQTGGLALTLEPFRFESVKPPQEDHPWAKPTAPVRQ